jgi:predicted DNA-binding transcriptional regulator YafY
MNLKRITRLLQLLQSLQTGDGQNATGMAEACGVTRRTVFRDLETLRAAGVPLGFDKVDDRYFIKGDFFLPPTNFTPAEALSIIALANQLGADDRLPFFRSARSAAAKLQASIPTPLRTELQRITPSIGVHINAVNRLEGQDSVYEQLVAAIANRRTVRILYGSLTEWQDIATKLRPYELIFNRRSWYVIGRSSLHGEPRTFNLSRIKDIEPTEQKYAIPRAFNLIRYFGNAWNMIPEDRADYQVTVRFSPLVAQNVAEVAWHRSQRVEWQPDGSLDFHVAVSGLTEIVWWILGYGDQAQVLRPKKLRRQIALRASNMLKMHRE